MFMSKCGCVFVCNLYRHVHAAMCIHVQTCSHTARWGLAALLVPCVTDVVGPIFTCCPAFQRKVKSDSREAIPAVLIL